MGEFTQLEKELLPVFSEIERIKERHGITSLTLESFNLIDQFYGSHGGKGNFMGKESTSIPEQWDIILYKLNRKEKPGEKRSGQVIYETFKPTESIAYMTAKNKEERTLFSLLQLDKDIKVRT